MEEREVLQLYYEQQLIRYYMAPITCPNLIKISKLVPPGALTVGIVVENVSKQFGSFKAVDEVSLEVESGSLVALLGPSGSGKSTLLRLIAGLEIPDSGRILLTDKDATYQSVQARNIGFVFQHYALFKHMSVR